MKKTMKLPGDIARVIKKVDNQAMTVYIDGLSIKMSRKQYDELMKCTLFKFNPAPTEGDTPPDGFYLVDTKTKVCTFKWLAIIKKNAIIMNVNDRAFKVNQPWKGFTYA